jgi:hypothetical protein
MSSLPARTFGKRLTLCFAMLGMASLSFLLGAAVMYFELPSQDLLRKGFNGGEAWLEQLRASASAPGKGITASASSQVDKPEKTFDGFTLYTHFRGSQALLINMRGDVVHRWTRRFSEVWPEPSHVRPGPASRDFSLCFFACHLFANGDLLAIYQSQGADTPYGYGLVKLDKDSKVIWRYSACAHHSVDVGEDGTIYTLTQAIVHEAPKGLEYLPTPFLVDYLVLLSPQGQELKKISVLEAFRDSPYSLLLSALARPAGQGPPQGKPPPQTVAGWKGDVLHTNAARVLSRRQARKFPMFKAGQVLISVRELDIIAVVDTESRAVVWAAHGPWRRQHDPHFLDNGHLLIFDNLGSPSGSRVLEYDPQTQALPWSYRNDHKDTMCGMTQRLPNGNTLIVNSDGGKLSEVAPGGELVWLCSCHPDFVPSARRYSRAQLEFLEAGVRARP